MSIKTIKIESLGELIDRVTPDKPDPVTGRRRDAAVYRGANDADAALLTSLDRLGGIKPHGKADLDRLSRRRHLDLRHSRQRPLRREGSDADHARDGDGLRHQDE